jgi:hypothetical protein
MGEAVFEQFHQAIVDKIEGLSKTTNASAGSHKDTQRHDDDDPPPGLQSEHSPAPSVR